MAKIQRLSKFFAKKHPVVCVGLRCSKYRHPDNFYFSKSTSIDGRFCLSRGKVVWGQIGSGPNASQPRYLNFYVSIIL